MFLNSGFDLLLGHTTLISEVLEKNLGNIIKREFTEK
jgi:hypothetical protein